MAIRSCLSLLLLLSPLWSQGAIYIPDAQASSGTCNTIPFASSKTYVLRLPASSMNPDRPRIMDVAFASCGTGTWSSSDVIIAMGHLPTPMPCPFTFPTGGSPGSFKDIKVLYNANLQGTLTYPVTQDVWSPMGLAGGGGFTWNGADDVGFFITFQDVTLSGISGMFHRTDTEPTRTYADGYQASVSTVCEAASGLKTRLDVRPAGNDLFIPDADPTTGTCNFVPFGQSASWSAAMTYMARVPATTLDPQNPVIWDVGFAPCGSGTWSADDAVVAIGHLPSPYPCPFQFPQGTHPGAFDDITILWDSAIQGPLSWTATANTWSQLGLSGGLCHRGFQWDGVRDIGFFITFRNANVVGWSGSCHRTDTLPTRSWETIYQATQATVCAEPLGLKMVILARNEVRPDWQTNQPGSRLTVNGALSSSVGPVVTRIGVGQTATAQFSSTNTGLGWDLVLTSPEPGVPVGGGGIELPDCQIINVDLLAPSLLTLFDLQYNVPFQNFAAPFSFPVPLQLSAQMVNLDPAQSVGVSLSALNRITVCNQNVLAGPATDDGFVVVNLGPGGLCANDMPFFGTVYDRMFVSANGRVTFGGPSTDSSPTVSEALNGLPSVGFWTDLDPSAFGAITISSTPAGNITIDYANVPYKTALVLNSFGIAFDTSTGTVRLQGLSGILPNPELGAASSNRQWLGLSPGGGNTADPGARSFSPGSSGFGIGGPAALYDFYSPGSMNGGLCPTLASGTNSLSFVPNGDGSYDWSAQ